VYICVGVSILRLFNRIWNYSESVVSLFSAYYNNLFLKSVVDTYVKSSTYIDLGHQYNFVCLQGIKELEITDYIPGNEALSVFQQRSNA
jgi:hypothetical protein